MESPFNQLAPGYVLALDIETARIPGLEPPPPVVNHGNRRDPLKIKIAEDEARAEQLDRLALDPHYAAVACCCMHVVGSQDAQYNHVLDRPPADDDGAEDFILTAIVEAMSGASVVVTYNGNGFDIPFIVRRAIKRHIPRPAEPFVPESIVRPTLRPRRTATGGPHSADVYAVVSEWHSNAAHCSMKLADAVRELLGVELPEPTYDKAKLHEVLAQPGGPEDILRNCSSDVDATVKLYELLLPYYP